MLPCQIVFKPFVHIHCMTTSTFSFYMYMPQDPDTVEPDDAINSKKLSQRFILSSLTFNYFGANPSLLSEQNLWPHMLLCSGQHQTFNCVWVKKQWHKMPHFTIWFLMAWEKMNKFGWTNPGALKTAQLRWVSCFCVCFWCSSFRKGLFY